MHIIKIFSKYYPIEKLPKKMLEQVKDVICLKHHSDKSEDCYGVLGSYLINIRKILLIIYAVMNINQLFLCFTLTLEEKQINRINRTTKRSLFKTNHKKCARTPLVKYS